MFSAWHRRSLYRPQIAYKYIYIYIYIKYIIYIYSFCSAVDVTTVHCREMEVDPPVYTKAYLRFWQGFQPPPPLTGSFRRSSRQDFIPPPEVALCDNLIFCCPPVTRRKREREREREGGVGRGGPGGGVRARQAELRSSLCVCLMCVFVCVCDVCLCVWWGPSEAWLRETHVQPLAQSP